MNESQVKLKELYSYDYPKTLESINAIKNGHNVLNRLDFLWYDNEKFGLHFYFNEDDISAAKNHFYICGLLDECVINKFESRLLDYGTNHICYALLSDNLPLIQRYANLTNKFYHVSVKKGNLIHAMQCIIRDDRGELEKDIARYEHVVSTVKGKINIPDLMYFKGMYNRDPDLVKQALLLSLKNHKRRNKYVCLSADFISIPAIGYAKLAWLKGIEVEIDHPLIPKELLPCKPLEKYTDSYDFLKEL